MFIELCKQRAGDFMLELLKPLFNTILRWQQQQQHQQHYH